MLWQAALEQRVASFETRAAPAPQSLTGNELGDFSELWFRVVG